MPNFVNAQHSRRLAGSYFLAFALVFALAMIAVHFAFAASFHSQTISRLHTLASAERGEADAGPNGFTLGEDEVGRTIDPEQEGIQWFDAAGKMVAQRGLFPNAAPPPHQDGEVQTFLQGGQTLETLTSAVRGPESVRPIGFMRVSRSDEPVQHDLYKLDLGLLCGFLIALAAFGLGGRYLARQSLAKIEKSLQTMETFTADAAHELRAPLATITSNAQASLREDDHTIPAAHRTRLEAISQAAGRMQRLADDLLILARADRSIERDLFVVDLDQRVEQVASQCEPLAIGKAIKLKVEAKPRLRVYGNPDQIDRIIANLVDNAIRYTNEGGEVTVLCREAHSGACLVVHDTGIGLSAVDCERIFERFWRGDSARSSDGGSGLGLAIVQALVRRHGAEITLSSTVGAGSEFTVWFPARPPATNIP